MSNWYEKSNSGEIPSQQEPLSVYCAWCKKLMRGDDIGYYNEKSSHGICNQCFKSYIGEDE